MCIRFGRNPKTILKKFSMTNALKSKIAKAGLGLVAAASLLIGAVSVSAYTFNTNLKYGMKGNADVVELQKALGVTPTLGNFGPATLAAVKAYQGSHGLPTTGFVGPLTRTALNAGGTSTDGTLPAGCTSTAGFSPTTGQSCATGTTTTTAGPVSVALASDSPVSGTVVSPSTGSVFAKFTFSGNGTVTALKLMRTGISQNGNLSNVYLYDGATRLTDAATFNSDNTATFSATAGLFTVMGTKTISVVADLAAVSADYGYSAGVTLTSVTSGGVVTPMTLKASEQYIASATLATVDFGTVTPTAGSVDPAKDVIVFNSNVAVGTRDVAFTRLAIRNIGSVNNTDIANFRLMVDGITVATVAAMDSNGYVTFALPTAKTLTTGTRVVKVMADVNGGSSRTFQFSIRNKTDVSFLDTQYNAGVAATFSSGNFPASPVAATSINTGSVTVQKASDSPSGNTILNGNDVVLAKYTLTTYGEPLKIETLKAGFTYTDNGGGNGGGATLRNGRIMINGSQAGSTATLLAAGTTFTTNYTVTPGVPVTVEIRADIYDNDGTDDIDATDTIVGKLVSVSNNTQKLSSLGYTTVPSADISGNTLTAQSAASLTMAKTSTYGSQTTAVPQTSSYKMASFTLSGNSVEDVNLDTVAFDVTSVTNATFSSADLTDVTLKIDGAVIGTPKSTVSATGNSFSITKTLAKNGSMTVELWANIGSTITAADSVRLDTTVSGVGASSSVASSTGAVQGQVIIANTGSITVTLDASRPDASINDDSGTKSMAAFKFAAVTDTYTVTDLRFTVADTTTTSMMSLWDGTTMLASKAASATTNFNGLSWVIPAGQSKVLTVKLDLGTVGVGAGSTGASTLVTFDQGAGSLATNGAGTSAAIATAGSADIAGTAQYTYKAIPTLTNVALPSSVLAAGTATLSKFTLSTSGTGTVGWNRMIWNITKTSAPTLASFTLWNADSNTQIAGTATIVDTADAATCLATLLGCRVKFVPTSEQQVSGAVTYALKATVAGTLVANDYVSTNMLAPSSFVASNDYSTIAGTTTTYAQYGSTASLVWSDVSASSHSTSTTDWANDYLVKSLPSDSQTITK